MAAKRIVREVQASSLMSGSSGTIIASGPSKTATDKLELAKRLASRINLTKQTTGPVPAIPETSIGAISVCNINLIDTFKTFLFIHYLTGQKCCGTISRET